jgi:hypothetical protein
MWWTIQTPSASFPLPLLSAARDILPRICSAAPSRGLVHVRRQVSPYLDYVLDHPKRGTHDGLLEVSRVWIVL